MNIKDFLVRGANGMADKNGTLKKFDDLVKVEREALNTALDSFDDSEAEAVAKVHDAIHHVFDRHPGVRLNMDYIRSNVIAAFPPGSDDVGELVSAYLKKNQYADGGAFVTVNKGKRAGTRRAADMKSEELAAIATAEMQ